MSEEAKKRKYSATRIKRKLLYFLLLFVVLAIFGKYYKHEMFNVDLKAQQWEWIIECGKYEDIYFISTDLIAVKNNKNKIGIINVDGELVCPFIYDSISKFTEGRAIASNDGKYVYIDENAKQVIESTYECVKNYSDGMGAVKEDGKWGFIDKEGKIVIECEYDEVFGFSEDRALVKIGDKWNFIDKNGKLLLKESCNQARTFQGGMAAICVKEKWGFINKNGEIVVSCEYDEVGDFSEGYAAIKKGNYWGYIDINGNLCIDFKYVDAKKYSEGLAAVKIVNQEGISEWGYIDKMGNLSIDFQVYDAAEGRREYVGEFKDGIAFVTKEVYCAMDKEGNILCGDNSIFFISSCIYYSEYDVIPGFVYADKEMKVKKYGLMGIDGKQKLAPVFDGIGEINGQYLIVEEHVGESYCKGIIQFRLD